jgi:cell division protein FtsI (penicillin-binding protein 3)
MEGIGILDEYKRFYPNQELAGQLLGVVGVDSQGIEGIEYSHDDVLFGKKSSIKMIRDALGRPIAFDETLFVEPQEGVSLILSIEQSLQFMIEKELELTVSKFQARRGAAIVQDVRTGEILAMANYPFFNPNRFFSGERSHWKNAALTDAFEPGSTFKVILGSAALENGISPSERFFCENGFYRVNREAAIREAENHKYGWLSFSDILKFSSNIGAAKIASQFGKSAFSRKILEFGFGRKTGIDAPGESAGIVRPYKEWGLIDLTNIAFGQGISVTAIQLVSAISAIANGGRLMRPFIVKKRIDPKMGEVIETEAQFVTQVMSPEAAQRLTRMLIRVTEEGGTGFSAAMKEYKVAGKTGTAQKPNLQGKGYLSDKYISSFLGFFSADQPHYAIFAMIDEPKKNYYAAEVAAPLFKQIAILTAQLFPPFSRVALEKKFQKNQKKAQRKKKPDFHNISERESAKKWDKMPELRGKSMYDVLKFGREAGIRIMVRGSGIAVDQCREEGSLIEAGQSCMVTFRAQIP